MTQRVIDALLTAPHKDGATFGKWGATHGVEYGAWYMLLTYDGETVARFLQPFGGGWKCEYEREQAPAHIKRGIQTAKEHMLEE